jgi:ABC-type sugar transport system ATPase subunit
MRGELKRLQREIGQTMIYVTHDQVEAMSMADKIAVMDFGVLQQYGTPDEVYYKPVNMFVANFIGSPNMNFLTATYRVEGARAFAVGPQLGDGRVDLTPRRAALDAALKDDVVVLGIRPEHVVVRDRTEDAPLRGTVRLYEPLGPKTVVHVQLGEGGSLRVVSPPDFRPRPGTTLGLELPTEWLHVFDPTTRAAVVSGDRAAGI